MLNLKTEVGDATVSTVELEGNHTDMNPGSGLFETIVFLPTFHDYDERRYNTREEAIAGHNEIVARLQSSKMESGFYWCYTLDSEGSPLESPSKPTIVAYDKDSNTVLLLGCDVPMAYDDKRYRLLDELRYGS